MNDILFWLGALVVVAVLFPVLKLTIAALFGREVGEMALAEQSDEIHLERRDATLWRSRGRIEKTVATLRTRGYEDAGVYSINEMPGLVVQLLAHERDGFYAAVYEHPAAGQWMDLASQFQDGSSWTLTTSRPTGLAPRPDHDMVHVPGLEVEAMLAKAATDRPRKWYRPVSTEKAVSDFQRGYAESMAWRKQTGITRGEVVKVATRKVA